MHATIDLVTERTGRGHRSELLPAMETMRSHRVLPEPAPGPPWLRIPFEDEAAAGLVIGGVWPEEIGPHPFQLFGAISRERLDAFVVKAPLMLPAKH